MTGANTFRAEWPELIRDLIKFGRITQEKAMQCPNIQVIIFLLYYYEFINLWLIYCNIYNNELKYLVNIQTSNLTYFAFYACYKR